MLPFGAIKLIRIKVIIDCNKQLPMTQRGILISPTGTPVSPTPISPTPISPTPVLPTLKSEVCPVLPTLHFFSIFSWVDWILGCYYHFVQALWRWVQNHGCVILYTENDEFQSLIKCTAALAHVPRQYLHLAWSGIKAAAPDMPVCGEFKEYFKDT